MLELMVAYSKNGIIGDQNKLIWHLADDLKNFKKITNNSTIVMGRKTFESIGRPLPNRRNIIISRNPNLKIKGCEIFNSKKEILDLSKKERVIIIGGSQIYNLFLKDVDILHLTEVECIIQGDSCFNFNQINFKNYKILERFFKSKDKNNEYNWIYKKYKKL